MSVKKHLHFNDEYLEELGEEFVKWWNTTYQTFRHDFRC